MRKIATLIFFLLASIPVKVFSAPPVMPGSFIGAAAAIIYDMDNEAILFEQNADQPIPPASLTKVMSMFLALDHIKNGHSAQDTLVTASAAAANAGGSSMGLHAGEAIPLGKLLLGMAVSSGNDASHAVAEHVGGSVPAFVRMMNSRATALGMYNTNFVNPHGLPDKSQYTTARDMLSLARAYLRAHPHALELHNTKLLEHRGYTTWNKNPLLGQYPGADGLKSGWVRASGHNLIFTATRSGRRLLGVILGAPDTWTRAAEACRLLDAGFMLCQNEAPTLTAALDAIPLDLSRIDARKTARDAGLLKPRPANKRLSGNKKILAKIRAEKKRASRALAKHLASQKTGRKSVAKTSKKTQIGSNAHAVKKYGRKSTPRS